jgi:hypothetical protein
MIYMSQPTLTEYAGNRRVLSVTLVLVNTSAVSLLEPRFLKLHLFRKLLNSPHYLKQLQFKPQHH